MARDRAHRYSYEDYVAEVMDLEAQAASAEQNYSDRPDIAERLGQLTARYPMFAVELIETRRRVDEQISRDRAT